MSCSNVGIASNCVSGTWYHTNFGTWHDGCTTQDYDSCWCSWDTNYASGTGRWSDCIPTPQPTKKPTPKPTPNPTPKPTPNPTPNPSPNPTDTPNPTLSPTVNPSLNPSIPPTFNPSLLPSLSPSLYPSTEPTLRPTYAEGAIRDELSTLFTDCIECHDSLERDDEISLWNDRLLPVYGGIVGVLICCMITLSFLLYFLIRRTRKQRPQRVVRENVHGSVVSSTTDVQTNIQSSDPQSGEGNAVEMHNAKRFYSLSSDNIGEDINAADVNYNVPNRNAYYPNPLMFPNIAPLPVVPVINPVPLPEQPHVTETRTGDDVYTDQCVDCGAVKKGKRFDASFYCIDCYNSYNRAVEDESESRESLYDDGPKATIS